MGISHRLIPPPAQPFSSDLSPSLALVTGPLGEFYFASWIARSTDKLPRRAMTKSREGKRTEEPRWEGKTLREAQTGRSQPSSYAAHPKIRGTVLLINIGNGLMIMNNVHYNYSNETFIHLPLLLYTYGNNITIIITLERALENVYV